MSEPSPNERTDMIILDARLKAPAPHPEFITRSALLEVLENPGHEKLILLAAPTGFGKTTLMADWVRQTEQDVAWLSLNERDNHVIRFLTYIISACQKIDPDIGEVARKILHTTAEEHAMQALIQLLNELGRRPEALTLILDDYQSIHDDRVHDVMRYMLEYAPDQLRFLIATRTDPPLSLSKLRIRRQIVEIRASDLRLTATEVRELCDLVNIPLSHEMAKMLVNKTEGWVAAIQMALLSLKSQSDEEGKQQFIQAFSGLHQHIVSYLADEVFSYQTEAIQTFLLQTSILDEFNADLCETVTQNTEARHILALMHQSHLFIEQIGHEGQWYRYHYLFRDFLSNRLQGTAFEVDLFYTRAIEWFEERNDIEQAIHYAIKGELWEKAAILITQHGSHLIMQKMQIISVMNFISKLPPKMVQDQPALSLNYARALVGLQRPIEDIESYLSYAERALETSQASLQDDVFQVLKAEYLNLRAEAALHHGAFATAKQLAEKALQYTDSSDLIQRAVSFQLQGYIALKEGQVERAQKYLSDSVLLSRQSNAIFAYQFAMTDNALALRLQGRLDASFATYQQVQTEFGDNFGGVHPVAAIGIAEIHYERRNTDLAVEMLEEAIPIAETYKFRRLARDGYILLARVLIVQGRIQDALALIEQVIEEANMHETSETMKNLNARRASIYLQTGDEKKALQWADATGFSLDMDVPYELEFQFVTYLRCQIVSHPDPDLVTPLERIIDQAQRNGRKHHAFQQQLMLVGLYSRLNRLEEAVSYAKRFLQDLFAVGYQQMIVDEGPVLIPVLRHLATDGHHLSMIQLLMAALDATAAQRQPHRLKDPLSERELEVLNLVALGMSNKEIAQQLVIGVTTVKSHVSNIIGKLGADNRTHATTIARELNIIT